MILQERGLLLLAPWDKVFGILLFKILPLLSHSIVGLQDAAWTHCTTASPRLRPTAKNGNLQKGLTAAWHLIDRKRCLCP